MGADVIDLRFFNYAPSAVASQNSQGNYCKYLVPLVIAGAPAAALVNPVCNAVFQPASTANGFYFQDGTPGTSMTSWALVGLPGTAFNNATSCTSQ